MASNSEYDLWIDVSNTPQVHVVKSLMKEFRHLRIFLTGFRRGETEELLKIYGLEGHVFGSDNYNPAMKSLSFALRSLHFIYEAPKTQTLLTFENAIPIPAAKIRGMRTILMLDNDLKLQSNLPIFQRIENSIKRSSDFVLVPEVARDAFGKHYRCIKTYPGYKEHIYLANFSPDPRFLEKLPFKEYVVLRPESLTSLYVLGKSSIAPQICRLLTARGINVIYLPRNREERLLADGLDVYIPSKALDGLNLCHFAKAVMTGSGTMAREAAILGVPAVTFFPRSKLLSVDSDLIAKGKLYHSRNPAEIVNYVIENWGVRMKSEFDYARKVRASVVESLMLLI